ncbi:DUF3043 domain-containing protein [Protaetiibacter intestinalis]|uniref:DUF3043 domain-containing protein n=1 Tax=Protaetiibacter intestinalis TaxID=2419774 RepID=A0A387BA10_9MICO|nr:DUF3043 domain-containing protein [Protaetiibacter intestinalis]AYF99193.1 DUF3043 domain-containing protein [Protaetiibacter intestinalis]
MPKNTPTDPTADAPENPESAPSAGKGHATPTRKEQEAARKRPLVPEDRKAASRESKAKLAEQRERARVGMANGEEKFLPIRDKGPQKKYVRDYVDARWSAGELLLPLMFLVILTYFVPYVEVAYYALIAVWVFIILVAVDCLVMCAQLQKKLTAKFGEGKVEKFRWYATMRAVQLRALRLPKPQVKRGKFPA